MSDTLILTLTNDYLFKLLLGSEENKVCLQDFLECVLDMPSGLIAALELLDKELAKETLVLSQVLQNIAAEATIDYSQYRDLKNTNGITNTLYLTGGQRTGTQLFST